MLAMMGRARSHGIWRSRHDIGEDADAAKKE
jgi:hypothetical protein